MAGISSKAALSSLSAYKYNAGSELEDEGGLNYYNTFYRKYDAQIGRFTGVDVMAESFAGLTPFQFGNNNPVFFNDPLGDKFDTPGRSEKGPDGNYHVGWVTEMLWNERGFYDFGQDGTMTGGGGSSGGRTFINHEGLSNFFVLSFGSQIKLNKDGEFGFWKSSWVDGASAGDGLLSGVVVKWDWIKLEAEVRGLIYAHKNYEAVEAIINGFPREMGKVPQNHTHRYGVDFIGPIHSSIGDKSGSSTVYSIDFLQSFRGSGASFGALVRSIYHERIHLGQYGKNPFYAAREVEAYYLTLSNSTLPGFDFDCGDRTIIDQWKSAAARYAVELLNSGYFASLPKSEKEWYQSMINFNKFFR